MRQVLISGASSDIGIRLCQQYLEKGYTVVAHYFKGQPNFFKLIKKSENILPLQIDFSDSRQFDSLIDQHMDVIQKTDVLINAAAILESIPFSKISSKDLLRVFTINLIPGILLVQSVIPGMTSRGWGRIVNLSSIGVKFGGGSASFCYALSKHALEFLPADHKTWAERNVYINTVRLGVTDTRIHGNDPSKDLAQRVLKIPAKRMSTVQEMSSVIFWLGSEENTYITGQTIAAAGGE